MLIIKYKICRVYAWVFVFLFSGVKYYRVKFNISGEMSRIGGDVFRVKIFSGVMSTIGGNVFRVKSFSGEMSYLGGNVFRVKSFSGEMSYLGGNVFESGEMSLGWKVNRVKCPVTFLSGPGTSLGQFTPWYNQIAKKRYTYLNSSLNSLLEYANLFLAICFFLFF